ncbi:hypothetical protein LEP1GSC058_1270 [Leptospira fainei serovar Hurstbridge str. BUT 6]|uniref:Tetratricopeptide repeat protein n=1 Tax=Leptospira fainei serovar Hurstbridge str. BUT 6 TaxID=1193011 RepID=S3V0L9_9LEPT|nr:hypothetical protein [Leptospira fainei]EPG76231.1 hypothetical protein LEP1GSC058_1270 [Leptospira fainei serovar Hurstbridge str. BUT 6]
MKRFEPKNVKSSVQVNVDPYADLKGAERAFTIFFAKVGEYRKQVLIGVVVLIVTTIAVVGWNEYRADQFRKGTLAVEALEKKFLLNPTIDLADKIKQYEEVAATYHSKSLNIRLSKIIGDLYARNGEFSKAATKLEWAGKEIDELPELKAYFFYIAGNYRESGNQFPEAEADYDTAVSLLNNRRNVAGFYSWSLYQSARLKAKNGKKTEAKENLRKVLEQEISSPSDEYKSVRELSTYLLVKLNQGS